MSARRGRPRRANRRAAPHASFSGLPSPCSAPTTRCASSSGSRRSTRSPMARGSDRRPRLVHRVVPLFGYDMSNYEALFEEKLNLFAEISKGQPVTWSWSAARAAVEPDHVSADRRRPLRTWVAVAAARSRYVAPRTMACRYSRHHRGKRAALHRVSAALSAESEPVRKRGTSHRHALTRPRGGNHVQGEGRTVAALCRVDEPDRGRAGRGRPSTARTSSAKRALTERCMSDLLKQWPPIGEHG